MAEDNKHEEADNTTAPSLAKAVQSPSIGLSEKANKVDFRPETLQDHLATEILSLFKWSLFCTLGFAGVLIAVDVVFIALKVISPKERLMTEAIIMTFVTATLVQVGAAFGAIVFSIFKSGSAADR